MAACYIYFLIQTYTEFYRLFDEFIKLRKRKRKKNFFFIIINGAAINNT